MQKGYRVNSLWWNLFASRIIPCYKITNGRLCNVLAFILFYLYVIFYLQLPTRIIIKDPYVLSAR